MVLRIPIISAWAHAKTLTFDLRRFCNLFLKEGGSYFLMMIICSGYLSLTTILSSAFVQLRTPLLVSGGVSFRFFCPYLFFSGSCAENTVLIPLGVWNFMAPWIVDTTIPILCMAVLLSSRLCGELDLTMTKLRTSVLVKGLSPIMISKGTSPRGQEYSLDKPTSGIFKSILSDLI
ncbi:hypothetical protein Tco_0916445 [Tanacetum coccineum]